MPFDWTSFLQQGNPSGAPSLPYTPQGQAPQASLASQRTYSYPIGKWTDPSQAVKSPVSPLEQLMNQASPPPTQATPFAQWSQQPQAQWIQQNRLDLLGGGKGDLGMIPSPTQSTPQTLPTQQAQSPPQTIPTQPMPAPQAPPQVIGATLLERLMNQKNAQSLGEAATQNQALNAQFAGRGFGPQSPAQLAQAAQNQGQARSQVAATNLNLPLQAAQLNAQFGLNYGQLAEQQRAALAQEQLGLRGEQVQRGNILLSLLGGLL